MDADSLAESLRRTLQPWIGPTGAVEFSDYALYLEFWEGMAADPMCHAEECECALCKLDPVPERTEQPRKEQE